MDKIILQNLDIFAHHGVNPEEKQNGQRFVLDVTLYLDLAKPCATDSLSDTVNYAQVVQTVTRAMTAQSDSLIERAAQRVAEAVLADCPAKAVRVRLKKPEAPIRAKLGCAAVDILRKREAEAG